MSVIVVTDAGPLINFLVVDRADLFGLYPAKIVVTDHVVAEVTEAYPVQVARLTHAIGAGWLEVQPVSGGEVVEIFAKLFSDGRLGKGECAAIAFAHVSRSVLVIDDRRAIRSAREMSQNMKILGTADLMVDLIHLGHLSLAEADQILSEWATKHRFRLSFTSFQGFLRS